MNQIYNNFGLTGQSDFDYFIFCGKKCKKKKAEKLKVRLEKKRLKNDQRRAETEQMRAETQVMKQTVTPTKEVKSTPKYEPPPAPVKPSPVLVSTPKQTQQLAPMTIASSTQKARFGTTPMILIGLAVIGGIVVFVSKK